MNRERVISLVLSNVISISLVSNYTVKGVRADTVSDNTESDIVDNNVVNSNLNNSTIKSTTSASVSVSIGDISVGGETELSINWGSSREQVVSCNWFMKDSDGTVSKIGTGIKLSIPSDKESWVDNEVYVVVTDYSDTIDIESNHVRIGASGIELPSSQVSLPVVSIPSDIGTEDTISASVTGVDDIQQVSYSWYVDEDLVGTDKDLYTELSMSGKSVYCIINYGGMSYKSNVTVIEDMVYPIDLYSSLTSIGDYVSVLKPPDTIKVGDTLNWQMDLGSSKAMSGRMLCMITAVKGNSSETLLNYVENVHGSRSGSVVIPSGTTKVVVVYNGGWGGLNGSGESVSGEGKATYMSTVTSGQTASDLKTAVQNYVDNYTVPQSNNAGVTMAPFMSGATALRTDSSLTLTSNVVWTAPTSKTNGGISGYFRTDAGDVTVNKVVYADSSYQTEAELKADVESYLNSLVVTNSTSIVTVKNAILALKTNSSLPLSVTGLSMLPATTTTDGSLSGTVTLSEGNTISINKSISKSPTYQTATQLKTAVQNYVDSLAVTNSTDTAKIKSDILALRTNTSLALTVGDLTLVPATSSSDGSLSGVVTFSSTSTISVSKTIGKSNSYQTEAELKTAIQNYIDNLSVSNSTSTSTVNSAIFALRTNSSLPLSVSGLNLTQASSSKDGALTGTVTLSSGNTVTINKVIGKSNSYQNEAELKSAVQAYIDGLSVTNSTSTTTVNSAILALRTNASLPLVVSGLSLTQASASTDGKLSGTVTFSAGNVITVNKAIAKNSSYQTEEELKSAIQNYIDNLSVSNSTSTSTVNSAIMAFKTNSSLPLTISSLTLTGATSSNNGVLSGTVTLSAGNTISINKVINKSSNYQTEAELKSAVQAYIDSLSVGNSTSTSTVNSAILALKTNSSLPLSITGLSLTQATSATDGKLGGTVTFSAGNTIIINKVIAKNNAYQTEAELKSAIQNYVNNLSVTNSTSTATVNSSILTLRTNSNLPLTITGLTLKSATSLTDGSLVGTVTLSTGNTISISKTISKGSSYQTEAELKTAVQNYINNLVVSNTTSTTTVNSEIFALRTNSSLPLTISGLTLTQATSLTNGSLVGTITFSSGVTVSVNKTITKSDSYQTEAELKSAIQTYVNNLSVNNNINTTTVKNDILSLKTNSSLALTVGTLTLVQATSSTDGSLTGTVTLSTSNTVSISKTIARNSAYQTEAELKASIQAYISNLSVSNSTDTNSVKTAISSLRTNSSLPLTVSTLVLTQATSATDGVLSGTVTLSAGNTISINKIIGKSASYQTEAELKALITSYVNALVVTNSTSTSTVTSTITGFRTNSSLPLTVSNLALTPATSSTNGSLTGTVTLSSGNVVSINKTIIKDVSYQTEAELKSAIQSYVNSLSVTNSTSTDSVKSAILALKTNSSLALSVGNLTLTGATSLVDGSLSGVVTLSSGNTVTISKTIAKNSNYQTESELKTLVQNYINNISASNSSNLDTIKSGILDLRTNASLPLTISTLVLKPATSLVDGSLTGTVTFSTGNTISINRPITKSMGYQTDAELKSLVESYVNKLTATNSTNISTIKTEITALRTNSALTLSIGNLVLTQATSLSDGSLVGTITLGGSVTVQIAKGISKNAVYQTESELRSAIESYISNLSADNSTSVDAVKNSINALRTNSSIPLTVGTLTLTSATSLVNGSLTGLVTLSAGNTISINKAITSNSVYQTEAELKTLINNYISNLSVSNSTSTDTVKNSITALRTNSSLPLTITNLALTPATSLNNGALVGTVTLSAGNVISINKAITKSTTYQTESELKSAIESYISSLSVSNSTDINTVKSTILGLKTNSSLGLTVGTLTLTQATSLNNGKLSGVVTLGSGDSININKVIANNASYQTEAELKTAVEAYFNALTVSNSTLVSDVKSSVLALRTNSNIGLVADNLVLKVATSTNNGSLSGVVTVESSSVTVNKVITKNSSYQTESELKALITEYINNLMVDNSISTTTVKNSILALKTNSSLPLSVDGLVLTPATGLNSGVLSGTVTLSVGNTVLINKTISKSNSYQTEAELKNAIESYINSLSVTNSTNTDTVKTAIMTLRTNNSLNLSINNIVLKSATSLTDGSLTGVVNIGISSSVTINKVISKASSYQTESELKALIQTYVNSLVASNTTNVDTVKNDILALRTNTNISLSVGVLSLIQATSLTDGSLSGVVTLSQGNTVSISKTITKSQAFQTEAELKNAIQRFIDALIVDNGLNINTVKSDIMALRTNSSLPLSITNLSLTQATSLNNGSLIGLITLSAGNTISVNKIIDKKTSYQTELELKALIENYINNLSVDNSTNTEAIKSAITGLRTNSSLPLSISNLTLSPATSLSSGSLSGSITLSAGTVISINKVITKSSSYQTESELKTLITNYVNTLSVDNSTDVNLVKSTILGFKTNASLPLSITGLVLSPANASSNGSLVGTVTLSAGNTISINKIISKNVLYQTEAELKASIESYLNTLVVTNSTNTSTVKSDIVSLRTNSNLPLTISTLVLTQATSLNDGKLSGTVTLSAGNVININKAIQKSDSYQTEAELKTLISNYINNLVVDNNTNVANIKTGITALRTNTSLALGLDTLTLKLASSVVDGSLTGTISIGVSSTVTVNKVITKSGVYQTEAELKALIESYVSSLSVDNSTNVDTVKNAILALRTNSLLPLSVNNVVLKQATSNADGLLSGTVTLSSGVSVVINKVVTKNSMYQTEAELKALIVGYLSSLSATNATSIDVVKSAIEALKTNNSLPLSVGNLVLKPATSLSDGLLSGVVTLSTGNTILINKVITKNTTYQTELELKNAIQNYVDNLVVNNTINTDAVKVGIFNLRTNSSLPLTIGALTLTQATSLSDGGLVGLITLSSGNTISVNKPILKSQAFQTEAELKALITSYVNNLNVDNSLDISNVKSSILALRTNSSLPLSIDNLNLAPATSTNKGVFSGVVTLSSGNTIVINKEIDKNTSYQTEVELKALIESYISNLVVDNSTNTDIIKSAISNLKTNPSLSLTVGTLTLKQATSLLDGSLTGVVTLSAGVTINVNKIISKNSSLQTELELKDLVDKYIASIVASNSTNTDVIKTGIIALRSNHSLSISVDNLVLTQASSLADGSLVGSVKIGQSITVLINKVIDKSPTLQTELELKALVDKYVSSLSVTNATDVLKIKSDIVALRTNSALPLSCDNFLLTPATSNQIGSFKGAVTLGQGITVQINKTIDINVAYQTESELKALIEGYLSNLVVNNSTSTESVKTAILALRTNSSLPLSFGTLVISPATSLHDGSLMGVVTLGAGNTISINKLIAKDSSLQTGSELKDLVSSYINNLEVSNTTDISKVNSDILALRTNPSIQVTISNLKLVPATSLNAGSLTGTVNIDSESAITINKTISANATLQTESELKSAIERYVDALTADNSTDINNIKSDILALRTNQALPLTISSLSLLPATSSSDGRLTGIVTLSSGNTISISKTIMKKASYQTEAELKALISKYVAELVVDNSTNTATINSSILAFRTNNSLPLSIDNLVLKTASSLNDGSLTGVVTLSTGNTVVINKVISKAITYQTEAELKDLIQKYIDNLEASNNSNIETITSDILSLKTNSSIPLVVNNLVLNPATSINNGSLTGVINFSAGNAILVNKLIDKAITYQTESELRSLIESYLGSLKVDNSSSTVDITSNIMKLRTNANLALSVDNLVLTPATSLNGGSLRGTVSLTSDSITINKAIDINSTYQTEAELKALIENYVNNIVASNDLDLVSITNDIMALRTNSSISLVVDNLKITPATSIANGVLNGVVRIGTSSQVPVSKEIVKSASYQTQSELKALIEGYVSSLIVDNSSNIDLIKSDIMAFRTNPSLQLSIDNLTLKLATSNEDGLLFGNINLGEGISVAINKVINKNTSYQTESELKVLIEKYVSDLVVDNSTKIETISSSIYALRTNSSLQLSIADLNLTLATSESNGDLTGLVTLSAGNTVTINKTIAKNVTYQTEAELKVLIQKYVDNLVITNDVNTSLIKTDILALRTNDSLGLTVSDLIVKFATSLGDGNLSGLVTLSAGNTVSIDKTISKDISYQSQLELKDLIEKYIANLVVSNSTNVSDVTSDINNLKTNTSLQLTIENLVLTPATSTNNGGLNGVVNLGSGVTVTINKQIGMESSYQTESELKILIQKYVDGLTVDNSFNVETAKTEILALRTNSSIPLSINSLVLTLATSLNDGSLKGLITLSSGNTINIDKVVVKGNSYQTELELRALIESYLSSLVVDNTTVVDTVKSGILGLKTNPSLPLSVDNLALTPATSVSNGVLTGLVTLSSGNTISINKPFDKRNEYQTEYELKSLIQVYVNSLVVDNSTDIEIVKETILSFKTNPDLTLSVDNLLLKPASSLNDGSLTGVVSLSAGDTIAINKVISKAITYQTETELRLLIEKYISDLLVTNSTNIDTIKSDILNLRTNQSLAISFSDIVLKQATSLLEGSLTGTINLPSNSIAIDKPISIDISYQTESELKILIEDYISRLDLSDNVVDIQSIISTIEGFRTNSSLGLSVENLSYSPANATNNGVLQGEVVLDSSKVEILITVNKGGKYQSESELKSAIESYLSNLIVSNSTSTLDVKSDIESLRTNSSLTMIISDIELSPASANNVGRLTGSVTLSSSTVKIDKEIASIPSYQTESELRQLIENYVSVIDISSNTADIATIKSDISALRTNDNLKLSIENLVFTKATSILNGVLSGTVVLDTGTVVISKSVSASPSEQTVSEAKSAIEAFLESFVATNATTADDVLSKIKVSAITNSRLNIEFGLNSDAFSKVLATEDDAGSVSGRIRVYTSEQDETWVNLDSKIERLMSTSSGISSKLSIILGGLSVDNSITKDKFIDLIKSDLLLQGAVLSNIDIDIDSFSVLKATDIETGRVYGTIVVSNTSNTGDVSSIDLSSDANKVIISVRAEYQTTETLGKRVKGYLSTVSNLKNSITASDILNMVKEQNFITNNNLDYALNNFSVVPATESINGQVQGVFVVFDNSSVFGNYQIDLSKDLSNFEIEASNDYQGVDNILNSLLAKLSGFTACNSTLPSDILGALELGSSVVNSDIEVNLSDFNKVKATDEESGYITCKINVVSKTNSNIKGVIDLTTDSSKLNIEKRAEYQTAGTLAKAIRNKLNSYTFTNSTSASDILSYIDNFKLVTNSNLLFGFSSSDIFKVVNATSEKDGYITGTILISNIVDSTDTANINLATDLLNNVISNKPEYQSADNLRLSILGVLRNFTATNNTVSSDIISFIRSSGVLTSNFLDIRFNDTTFSKKLATYISDGSVVGAIEIISKTDSSVVSTAVIDSSNKLVIKRLLSSNQITDIINKITDNLESYTPTNATTKEDIVESLNKVVNDSNILIEIEDDTFKKDLATSTEDGSITFTVTIKDKTSLEVIGTVVISENNKLVIASKPEYQTSKELIDAIEEALKDFNATNDTKEDDILGVVNGLVKNPSLKPSFSTDSGKSFELNKSTSSLNGSITGVLVIGDSELSINIPINMLPSSSHKKKKQESSFSLLAISRDNVNNKVSTAESGTVSGQDEILNSSENKELTIRNVDYKELTQTSVIDGSLKLMYSEDNCVGVVIESAEDYTESTVVKLKVTDIDVTTLSVYAYNDILGMYVRSTATTQINDGVLEFTGTGKSKYILSTEKLSPNITASSGWNEKSGSWYYLNNEDIKTGWVNESGNWFKLDEASKKMSTGWVNDNNNWYYLNPISDGTKGKMKTGWVHDGSTWYYCDSDGSMVSNAYRDGYYLGSNGAWEK